MKGIAEATARQFVDRLTELGYRPIALLRRDPRPSNPYADFWLIVAEWWAHRKDPPRPPEAPKPPIPPEPDPWPIHQMNDKSHPIEFRARGLSSRKLQGRAPVQTIQEAVHRLHDLGYIVERIRAPKT